MKKPLSQITESLRWEGWLAPRMLRRAAIGIFIVELALFIILALATHDVFGPMPQPVSTDFISFYAAGRLANDGFPALVYDEASHRSMEQLVFGDERIPYYHFLYPPIFLPVCQLLAHLPYLAALIIFISGTGLMFFVTMLLILGGRRQNLLFLTFPPIFFAAGLGQNSFLTAALLALATLLCDRRPFAAGAVWGLLSYKPHFLIMAPLALLAGRRWRAFAGLVLSVSGLIAFSLLLYGAQCWLAYLPIALHAPRIFADGTIPPTGLVSLFAAARLLGLPAGPATILQIIGAFGAGIVVVRVWRSSASQAVRAVTVVAATALATPVILFYDLTILAVAIAWLVREARSTGFMPWEKTLLAVVWAACGLALPLAEVAHLPTGPVPAALLMALAIRRLRLAAA